MNNLVIQTSAGKNLPAGRKGAVVITNSEGAILAMYSMPSYDPNIFVNGNSASVNAAFNDPNLPLDRKSTRLNSSHPSISYAVFCWNNKTMSWPMGRTYAQIA